MSWYLFIFYPDVWHCYTRRLSLLIARYTLVLRRIQTYQFEAHRGQKAISMQRVAIKLKHKGEVRVRLTSNKQISWVFALLLIFGALPRISSAEAPVPPHISVPPENHDANEAENKNEPQKPPYLEKIDEYCPIQTDETADTWVDLTHARMSSGLCRQVNRIDSFFGNIRQIEAARGFLQIRNGVQWQQLGETGVEFQSSVKGRVRLPNINRRLNLLFSDDENDRDTIPTFRNRASQDNSNESSLLGDLLGIKNSDPVDYDFDVGTKSDDGPKLFTRVRAIFEFWPSSNSNLQLSQSFFWLDGLGYGEESRLDYNQTLSESALFRWTSIAEFSEETAGLYLEQNVIFYQQLDPKRGISYNLRVLGETRPTLKVNEYGFLVLYRRNILRPWLFYEVEPSIFWPIETDREMALRLIFRLEVQLGDVI